MQPAPLICNLLTHPSITYKSKSGKLISCSIANPITMTTISADGKEQSLLNKISNFDKLLRVTAYVNRFILNLKIKTGMISKYPSPIFITVPEYKQALTFWISHTQRLYFKVEINAIVAKKPVPGSSSLAKLTPMLDEIGLLRTTGR